MGPSEVQKVESYPIPDLIEFSATQMQSNQNLNGPNYEQAQSDTNESINLIQFSANHPNSTQQTTSPTNVPVSQSPSTGLNISSNYGERSEQLPMIQDLLPSQGDISSAVIPQFSTLLGVQSENGSQQISSSAFIPITVNDNDQSAYGQESNSSEDMSSASISSVSSTRTIIPDEISGEFSGMLPAVLDEPIGERSTTDISITDDFSSSSRNIPLLSAIGPE